MNRMFGYRLMRGSRLSQARVAVINVTLRSSNGQQTISASTLGGLTPVAAIFSVNRGRASDNSMNDSVFCLGFTDGASEYCISGSADTGIGTTDTGTKLAQKIMEFGRGNASSTALQAEFVSFQTNGVTINLLNADADNECTVMLVAGCQAHAGLFNPNDSSSGTASLTGAGFSPRCGVFLNPAWANADASAWSGHDNGYAFSVGFCDRGLNQFSHNYTNADNQGTTAITGTFLNSSIGSGGADGVELTSWDSDGFTATSNAAINSNGRIACLLLNCEAFCFTDTVDSTGTLSVTGASFTPTAVLGRFTELTTADAVQSSGSQVEKSAIGLGGNIGGTVVQGSHRIKSDDNAATATEICVSSTAKLFNETYTAEISAFTVGGVNLTIGGTASSEYIGGLLF